MHEDDELDEDDVDEEDSGAGGGKVDEDLEESLLADRDVGPLRRPARALWGLRPLLEEQDEEEPADEPAPAPEPPPHDEVTKVMSGSNGRGALRELVAEAVAAFAKKNGRNPSARELFEEVGEEDGKSPNNVRFAAERLGITLASGRRSSGEETGGGRAPYQEDGEAEGEEARGIDERQRAREGLRGRRGARSAVARHELLPRDHGAPRPEEEGCRRARRHRQRDRATAGARVT